MIPGRSTTIPRTLRIPHIPHIPSLTHRHTNSHGRCMGSRYLAPPLHNWPTSCHTHTMARPFLSPPTFCPLPHRAKMLPWTQPQSPQTRPDRPLLSP